MNHSGIVHTSGSVDGIRKVYLPLEEVRVRVLIVDVSARVTLSQVYSNPSDTVTSRAKYCFPVPASAAVCAFEMRTDGRVITGVSKEKEAARVEYENAVSAGQFAGMLDYVTDDIFTISIGSIPARETVETKLMYVMSLANDDNTDEVRLQLPMYVGQRYGQTPSGIVDAASPSSHTRVRITVDIQTNGRIRNITSPSHNNGISETRYPTHLERLSRRRSTVRLRSREFLERDFILIVQADKLDSPRCFAELERDPEGIHPDTIAMQLTIIPKFILPPIVAQEYLFVVDRSGSMKGNRIETAQRTLVLLLRMLPSQGTVFNIFSFGNHVDGLWPQSQAYSQESLLDATRHADSMSANYGGTEICQALQYVFKARKHEIPTAVFVLTDGEAHDIEPTVLEVQNAVGASTRTAPLRVFTLGIGDTVSTAMCEGIARAGNGVCLFAVNTESILGKCARLFRAGRTPFVKDVTINWGIPIDHLTRNPSSVNFLTHSPRSGLVNIQRLPVVQQAPTHVHAIHAGTRINLFVILALKKTAVPKEVTIRGTLDNTGEIFELTVPIRGIQLADTEPGLPLVHTLAAWRLIQEHEERLAPLPQAIGRATDEEIRKSVIVQLGEKYQLVSRHTSFVAVDSGEESQDRRTSASHQRSSSPGDSTASTIERHPDSHSSPKIGLGSAIRNLVTGLFGSSVTQKAGQWLPGAWPDSPSAGTSQVDVEEDGGYASESSADSYSTMSSLQGSTSDWSPPPSPRRRRRRLSDAEMELQRSPSPQLEPMRMAPERDRARLNASHVGTSGVSVPLPVRKEVIDLVRLQLFDGSFELDDTLRHMVGARAVDEIGMIRTNRNAWATALSIAFISLHMNNQKELLDDFLLKAREYLHGSLGEHETKKLVEHAKSLIKIV